MLTRRYPLTREVESLERKQVGSERKPMGYARNPVERFSNQRVADDAASVRNPTDNWRKAQNAEGSLPRRALLTRLERFARSRIDQLREKDSNLQPAG